MKTSIRLIYQVNVAKIECRLSYLLSYFHVRTKSFLFYVLFLLNSEELTYIKNVYFVSYNIDFKILGKLLFLSLNFVWNSFSFLNVEKFVFRSWTFKKFALCMNFVPKLFLKWWNSCVKTNFLKFWNEKQTSCKV